MKNLSIKPIILTIAIITFIGSNLQAQWSGTNPLTTSSDVGIGTTTPENVGGWDRVLDVRGTNHSKMLVTTGSAAIITGLWSHSTGGVGAPAGGWTGTATNHPFTFLTNASPRMIIDNSGKVGIGTTSPSSKFEVHSNASETNGTFINTNSTGPSLLISRDATGNLAPSSFSGVSLTTSPCTYGLAVTNSYNNIAYNYGGFFKATGGNNSGDWTTGMRSEATAPTGYPTGLAIAFDGETTNAVNSYGLRVLSIGTVDAFGVKSEGAGGNHSNYGVFARGSGLGDCTADVFGVYGKAQSGKYNYGIYGSVNSFLPEGCTGNSYAGYFDNKVFATEYMSPSDIQFKENIKGLENALDIISRLSAKTYTFKKNDEFLGIAFPEGLRYGFIAQEIEKILPGIVKQSHNPEIKDKENKIISKSFDFKAVDYNALIPILVEGMKEQQIQIEELKMQIRGAENIGSKNNNTKNTSSDKILEEPVLFQNTPNPFGEKTTIKYHLKNTNDESSIIVFDLNGKLVKSYPLDKQNMDGEIQIVSGTFISGMYYYSLVVNGKEINTMKMILTK